MDPLNLPRYSFSIKEDQNKNYIFDEIRRRYVRLTPEEWVRQHIIQFLSEEKSYPRALISVEKGFNQKGRSERYDLLIYNRSGQPLMLVECKAPVIEISQQAFDQAIRYNEHYQAPYILITNGRKHFCCLVNKEERNFEFLKEIPVYTDLY